MGVLRVCSGGISKLLEYLGCLIAVNAVLAQQRIGERENSSPYGRPAN